MKDKKEIFIIILLIANLAVTIFLFTGLKQIDSNIQDVQDNMYYNLKIITSDINSQLAETLLKDEFRVVDMSEEMERTVNENQMLEGRITFELTDNADLDSVHVIINNAETDEYEKVDAVELGGLKYRALVELDYKQNYTYYVLGETENGTQVMLSEKRSLDLKDKMQERIHIQVNTISLTSDTFAADGVMQVAFGHQIEKIEAVLIYYDEDIMAGTATVAGEIGRVDITDSMVPEDEIKMNNNTMMETLDGYIMYGFDFEKEMTGYTGQEPYGLMLVVTFDDGVEIEVWD